MKKLHTLTATIIATIISMIIFVSAMPASAPTATTYYFSATGNDANNGTSTGTPWKTLAKFNSFISSATAGDQFLFKRGETFYGSIKINKAGSSGNPIVLGAYGTGANPIITGLTPVVSWVHLGDNIWESVNPVSTATALNMVVINGVNVRMGRYPNAGYLTYTAPTTTTKTVASLNAATKNWTGATAVMRLHHWITDNNRITAHSGTVLTHVTTPNPTTYNGISGYGLFIQNDIRTLDMQNEWYYNPNTKKLNVYSNTCSPMNVQIPTIDTLVWLPKVGAGYITIENIKFTGSNMITMAINAVPNLTIQNCQFDFAGQDCIWGGKDYGSPFSPNFVFQNNTVNHTNNNGLFIEKEFSPALIDNNTFDNTAMHPGMGKGGDGQMSAIRVFANNVTVSNNVIDSTGYLGVEFYRNNVDIGYNTITNFNMAKMDGGGIYTFNHSGFITGCRVHHNTVHESYPSIQGTTQSVGLAHGIYLDNNTTGVQVDSNTVYNIAYSCMYLNTGSINNNIFGNHFYNAGVQVILQKSTPNTFTNNTLVP